MNFSFESILELANKYLSDYFEVTAATMKSPSIRFMPIYDKNVEKNLIDFSKKSSDFTGTRLNSKIFGFVLISIFLGITINTLTPNRKSGPDFLASIIIIIVFWILSSTMIHWVCKLLRGRGSYIETMSVSLQLNSVLYLISSSLTLAFAMIIRIPLIAHAVVKFGDNAKWIVENPVYSFFLIQALLNIVYLPLALCRVHHFGLFRQILMGVNILALTAMGTLFSVSIYESIGILFQAVGRFAPASEIEK